LSVGSTPAGIIANKPVPANAQVSTALLDFLRRRCLAATRP